MTCHVCWTPPVFSPKASITVERSLVPCTGKRSPLTVRSGRATAPSAAPGATFAQQALEMRETAAPVSSIAVTGTRC